MSLEYGMPIVLPPIGPLFPTSWSIMTFLTYESAEQREIYEEGMARYLGVPLPSCVRHKSQVETVTKLCTPTGVQLMSMSFILPSESSDKRESGHRETTLPLSELRLDSSTRTDNLNEREHSSKQAKLHVSRERNRLHAQRTRVRNRELLKSLKERTWALHDEFELLKQAYDFHATAVCLLKTGRSS